MTNYLRVDTVNRQLVMDKAFAKNASIVGSREYEMLQQARNDYKDFTVIKRTIKKNPNKESYKGLTYDYMEDYIRTHEDAENVKEMLNEFREMRLISQCHSKAFRYPIIKKWFLEQYPEIEEYGMNYNKISAFTKSA